LINNDGIKTRQDIAVYLVLKQDMSYITELFKLQL